MSALAMILMAAMVVPVDAPARGSEKVSGEAEQGLDLSGRWEGTLLDEEGNTQLARLENHYLDVFVGSFDNDRGGFGCDFVCTDEGKGKCKIGAVFAGPPLGIYKREDDRLKLCVSFDGKYPASFRGSNAQWLLTLHRVKPRK